MVFACYKDGSIPGFKNEFHDPYSNGDYRWDWTGPGLHQFPSYMSYSNTPPYQVNTEELIFNSLQDFDESDPSSAINDPTNGKSISRVLNLMSKPNEDFKIYADVFRDPTGKPIVVDVPLTNSSGSTCTGISCMNGRVGDRMNQINPNFDFSAFDNRDNAPNYGFDNSQFNEDGTPASGDGE
ncbi:MAG: hypothetical protein ACPG5P_04335, partial [Saprospiraceae bacterium]